MLKKFFLISLLLCCYQNTLAFEHNSVAVVAAENHLIQYQENNVNKGPTIAILNNLLAESQVSAEVSFMPWARAFSKALKEPNTLVLSMIRTPERENQFHWLIKVSQTARVFISLKNQPQNAVVNAHQAKSKLTAVIRGSSAHKELVSKGFSGEKNLYLVSSDNQMISLFLKGRVDLLYTDPNLVLDYINEKSEQDIDIFYSKITTENQRHSYIAANKNTNKDILSRLQKASDKFQKTPRYQYLLKN